MIHLLWSNINVVAGRYTHNAPRQMHNLAPTFGDTWENTWDREEVDTTLRTELLNPPMEPIQKFDSS